MGWVRGRVVPWEVWATAEPSRASREVGLWMRARRSPDVTKSRLRRLRSSCRPLGSQPVRGLMRALRRGRSLGLFASFANPEESTPANDLGPDLGPSAREVFRRRRLSASESLQRPTFCRGCGPSRRFRAGLCRSTGHSRASRRGCGHGSAPRHWAPRVRARHDDRTARLYPSGTVLSATYGSPGGKQPSGKLASRPWRRASAACRKATENSSS